MNTIVALGLALLALMVAVGGRQGISNFLALLVNAGLMILAVILMAGGFAPVGVAVVIGLLVLAVTIFLSTNHPQVAGTAFVASLLVMVAVVVLVVGVTWLANTGGFGAEDAEELEGYSLTIGVRFDQVAMAAGMLGTLGAIAEAACAVAADVNELGPAATPAALAQVQGTIIGTALNTLFFGFFGGFAALFIWFTQLHYPVWEVVNDQLFVSELIQVLFAVVAVAMTVPVTIWVARRRG